MLLPNKTISYNESVLMLFPLILHTIEKQPDISAVELYNTLKEECTSVIQFTQSMDCLFALGRIDFSAGSGGLILC